MDWKSLVFVALLVTSALTYGCLKQNEPVADDEEPQLALLNVLTVDQSGELAWSGSGTFDLGTNCLDAMKTLTEVQTQDTAFGPMVLAIDGLYAPDGYYWALYIDNAYSNYGINDCKLYSTKLVMWRLEQVQAGPVYQ